MPLLQIAVVGKWMLRGQMRWKMSLDSRERWKSSPGITPYLAIQCYYEILSWFSKLTKNYVLALVTAIGFPSSWPEVSTYFLLPEPSEVRYLCSGQKCHSQAQCLGDQDMYAPRCVCNNGYQGDGVTCAGKYQWMINNYSPKRRWLVNNYLPKWRWLVVDI